MGFVVTGIMNTDEVGSQRRKGDWRTEVAGRWHGRIHGEVALAGAHDAGKLAGYGVRIGLGPVVDRCTRWEQRGGRRRRHHEMQLLRGHLEREGGVGDLDVCDGQLTLGQGMTPKQEES